MIHMETPAPKGPSTVSSSVALRSASSLMLLQLLSRAATFGLNQGLVRLVSPEIFGTATIQFELLLSTILFMSREGVRNSLLRASPTSSTVPATANAPPSTSQSTTNISLLPVIIGVPLAMIASSLFISSSDTTVRSQPHFEMAVNLYTVAAILELLSEPLHIKAQNELQFGVRLRAEGTAVVLKSVVTIAVLIRYGPQWALPAFALGQVSYGLIILGTYIWRYRVNLLKFRDGRGSFGNLAFDSPLLRLSLVMTAQSIVKHFLTEGDKFVISRISSLEDQGGYAIASNYGSLVARIVFQPIEETSRLFFSKTLSLQTAEKSSPTNSPKEKNPNSHNSGRNLSLTLASTMLETILLFHVHLTLLLLAFSPPYIATLLALILPYKYRLTSAPRILQVYATAYLPTMAFNGVLEAFLSSAATSQDLARQSRWMLVFSAVFIGSVYIFVERLGWRDTGLVWANVVNLGSRATYGWIFAKRYFLERMGNGGLGLSPRKILPPYSVLCVFAVSGCIVRWTKPTVLGTWKERVQHVGIGLVCLATCFLVCFISERHAFRKAVLVLRGGPAVKKE